MVIRKPLISIIIPLYNKEKYIKDCIESIQSQSETNWECIIVDDGSTDTSLNIVTEYSKEDNRIKVFTQENQGPSVARNRGIIEATGEFVHFLDSDDYYPTINVIKDITAIIKKEKPVVISGNVGILDNDTDEINYQLETKVNETQYRTFAELQHDYFFCRFFFSREFLITNNIVFPEYTYVGEDPVFLVKALSLINRYLSTNIPVYVYNRKGSSNSDFAHYDNAKILGYMTAQAEVLEIAKKKKYDILTKLVLHRINVDLREIYIEKSLTDKYIKKEFSILQSYNPLVSIVIPVFNTNHQYLEQCLRSVKKQTYLNIEVVIVDDGSGIETAKYLDTYSRRQNWRVIHQKNAGLSAARNTGFQAAKGRYVHFLDSDDYISTDLINNVVDIAEKHNSDIVIENYIIKNENKNTDISWSELYGGDRLPSSPLFAILDVQGGRRLDTIPFNVWSKLFRKSFLKSNNILHNDNLMRCEDVVFSLKAMLSTKKIAYSSKPLLTYREEVLNSNTSTNDRHVIASVEAWHEVYQFLVDNNIYSIYKEDYIGAALGSIYWHYEKLNTDKARYTLAKAAVTMLDGINGLPMENDTSLRLILASHSPDLLEQYNKKQELLENMHDQIYTLDKKLEAYQLPTVKFASRKLAGAMKRSVKARVNRLLR